MNTAPLILKVHYYLSLVLFFLCLFFLPNTQFGQSNIDLYHNHGDERMPFYEDEDLIFSDHIQFFRGNSSDYLMVMDTLKTYSIVDGELRASRLDIFEYDEEFRITKQEIWSYNSSSQDIIPVSQRLYEFDELGLITSDTFFTYISQLNSWGYVYYRDIEHESNQSRATRFNWNAPQWGWDVFSITEREYEDNILTKRSTYFWRDHLQDFRLEEIIDRQHEGSILKYQINYRYDIQGDSLYLNQLTEYQHNDKDLLESINNYRSNLSEGSELKPFSRWEYDYNELNQMVESTYFEPYSIELFGSEFISKKEDDGVFNLQITGEDFLTNTSDSLYGWNPVFRIVRDYDQHGDWSVFTRYEISEDDPEVWINTRRTEFERDYNYSIGAYIPYILFANDQHMLLREIDYGLPSEEIIIEREYIYSQVLISSTYEIDPDNPLTIFPNPTKDMIHIELDQQISNLKSIHVVDMLGRLWHSGEFNSPMELNVQNWPTGIYNVVISDKESGTVVTRQVVKQ